MVQIYVNRWHRGEGNWKDQLKLTLDRTVVVEEFQCSSVETSVIFPGTSNLKPRNKLGFCFLRHTN